MCLLPPKLFSAKNSHFVNREVLMCNTLTCKSGSGATMNECGTVKWRLKKKLELDYG